MMTMGWRQQCRWLGYRVADGRYCPNALRRSLKIGVVRGGCPVRLRIEAFVT